MYQLTLFSKYVKHLGVCYIFTRLGHNCIGLFKMRNKTAFISLLKKQKKLITLWVDPPVFNVVYQRQNLYF